MPNFLLRLVALASFMRFSLTENRIRGRVSEQRGRKFGCARDDKGLSRFRTWALVIRMGSSGFRYNREAHRRSLGLPNFLLRLVALASFMRFSLTENRIRGRVSEQRGRKFGCARMTRFKSVSDLGVGYSDGVVAAERRTAGPSASSGFPVKLSGVGRPHAAFLTKSRIRGR